ncbi:MAG: thiamine pyrophosphate-dependent enzyme [Mycobacterium sp.]
MVEPIDEYFTAAVTAMRCAADTGGGDESAPVVPGSALTVGEALRIFDAQLGSRHLDLAARALRADGQGYYTIGSSGHESNAAVAAALRPTDPALLHYRSGGFFLHRGRQVPSDRDPVRDVLLGIVAAAEEPIAGGRHKVFGRYDLNIIPQTSTIASHLPRAFGVAFTLQRAHKLTDSCPWPADAITVCSFGDASVNHSTAVGAINAALNTAYRELDLPLLLVCEDNGIGISTKTPDGWIGATYANRPGLAYFTADGADLPATHAAAVAAADWVRRHRRPAFLHLRTVRLMGHAGSDFEAGYRTPRDITSDYARDPVLSTAALLVEHGHRTPAQILDLYERTRATVMGIAAEVADLPALGSAEAVLAPITTVLDAARFVSEKLPDRTCPPGQTLAQAINFALRDIFETYPQALLFGEDVARKGGVYGVTRGLQKQFGASRVFDTILDEQTILGLALGAGLNGLLPIPEIQYLAYLHNALDQIRGEGASLGFFSNGRYRNPAVVRIAGYGYQKGFGGHFHNDDSVAALLDIPGVIVASPSHPDDAHLMLRACAGAAAAAGALCLFVEPIALYHTRDLHDGGDDGWLSTSGADATAVLGTARTHGDGTDLTIITFGNGVPMSLRVAQRLRRSQGIDARVTDLRWLAPLPVADIVREAEATGRVLIVDETRHSGGVGQHVLAALADNNFQGVVRRVASADSFIPLGPAALRVLLDEDTIETAATALSVPGR